MAKTINTPLGTYRIRSYGPEQLRFKPIPKAARRFASTDETGERAVYRCGALRVRKAVAK